MQSPFHDVVAAPDRPVGIVIVWRGLRAPYCTNTMLSMHSLRVRSAQFAGLGETVLVSCDGTSPPAALLGENFR